MDTDLIKMEFAPVKSGDVTTLMEDAPPAELLLSISLKLSHAKSMVVSNISWEDVNHVMKVILFSTIPANCQIA